MPQNLYHEQKDSGSKSDPAITHTLLLIFPTCSNQHLALA